jgi:hypothetical protein
MFKGCYNNITVKVYPSLVTKGCIRVHNNVKNAIPQKHMQKHLIEASHSIVYENEWRHDGSYPICFHLWLSDHEPLIVVVDTPPLRYYGSTSTAKACGGFIIWLVRPTKVKHRERLKTGTKMVFVSRDQKGLKEMRETERGRVWAVNGPVVLTSSP